MQAVSLKTSNLRTGYTTGSCAAAAAKAAAIYLFDGKVSKEIDIPLQSGNRATLSIVDLDKNSSSASAGVIKDGGDDPDITTGLTVISTVEETSGSDIFFAGGEGVGKVTLKGLQIEPGEPAINPVPRKMIKEALREVTTKSLKVTVSIPGGEAVSKRTFNPRLGIIGGLSILGTTGIVRPYSHPAIVESLKLTLDVSLAGGVTAPVFTAGNIGSRAAKSAFNCSDEAMVEVGNHWGFMLDLLKEKDIGSLLVIGHPGKLIKLINDDFDTHSSRSASAVPKAIEVARKLFGDAVEDSSTVEGVIESFNDQNKKELADELSKQVKDSIEKRTGSRFPVAVALVNMKEVITGSAGEFKTWNR